MDVSALYTVALVLIAVGIIIVIAAILASTVKSGKTEGGGNVKGAGVIMIGPIPIIFGTDKKSVKTVVTLALALTVAIIVWYYLMLR
jgi:uncharacterized protein (TIGR00304 family)